MGYNGIRSTSGRCASYWNAFLFLMFVKSGNHFINMPFKTFFMYVHVFISGFPSEPWLVSQFMKTVRNVSNQFLGGVIFHNVHRKFSNPSVFSAKTINCIKLAGRRNIFQSREYLLLSCGLQNERSLLLL